MNTALSASFIVAKFGGTSLANYHTMCRSADIIISNPNIRLVVVSASAGITNLLLALAQEPVIKVRQQYLDRIAMMQMNILANIKDNINIKHKLNLLIDNIKHLTQTIKSKASAALTDELVSYGELLSSSLFTEIVKQKQKAVVWFDVRQVMRTDSTFGQAVPQTKDIKALCESHLKSHLSKQVIITQGFIGRDANGRTTTLGRGGSDYSAALLGEAINAQTIAIWSDVAGIYTADPRIVNSAKRINEISFSEAEAMATFGAKILHPATLMPALRSNMNIFVGSSQKKELGGTLVCSKKYCRKLPQFRAISVYKNQLFLQLNSINQINTLDLLANSMKVITQYCLSTSLLAASTTGMTLTIHKKSNITTQTIVTDLTNQLAPYYHVNIEENLALVTLIGNHLPAIEGTMSTIFNSLTSFSIRFICYGSNQHSTYILVNNDDADAVTCKLHQQLFE